MKKLGLALYILTVTAVGLAAVEFAARLKYQPPKLASNIVPDRTYHHLTPPHTKGYMSSEGDFAGEFGSNAQGMRGPADYSYEKKTPLRVAVLGDSYTFGVGVQPDETFCARLQAKADRAAPGRVEFLNFGVPSFSPVLEYLYLRNETLKYKPDLVIVMLDLCDVQDDYNYEQHLVYAPDGSILACDPLRTRGSWDAWQFLKTRSVLCSVLDEKVVQSYRKMRTIGFAEYFKNKKRHVRNKTEILLNPDIDNIEFDRFLFMREKKNPEIVSRHWERTAKYLKMIKDLCDRNGVRMALAAYPYGQEVGTNQWEKGREYWAFDKDKVYDASRPFGAVRAFAAKNDVPFTSLLEPMLAAASERLYYRNDGHWTAAGHRVAADALFDSPEIRRLLATA